jgi:hypothetical protein
MSTRLLLALVAALLLLRLPSLVQPMGPDQGLYAYVGDRILHGELAYRDAWDQKPPGIHYIYAGLRAVSHRDVVVPAADLVAAALVAALLWALGSSIAGPLAGGLSAVFFLLLSDPSLARYGGVRVRAQGETFIALAVSAALALLARGAGGAGGALGAARAGAAGAVLLAGGLVGVAFAIKYNAGLYAVVLLAALALGGRLNVRNFVLLAVGGATIPLTLLAVFWRGGALNDLYQATIAYNVQYSGETYAGPLDMARYLVEFPIEHARVDALWFLGGLGSLVLLIAGYWRRAAWIPVAWVAVACVSIMINGSRNLPQYFVQAAPALALAAGVAAAFTMPRLPKPLQWIVAIGLAVFVWRAGDDPFPKLAHNVWQDTSYALGRVDRRTHLARFGGRDVDKYSALDNADLGAFFAAHTRPDESVYVFGYSPASYVYAERKSASRFFWSRPVIVDFNRADPSYGVAGLAADLARSQPAYIALQMHDWPDVGDSGPFFLSRPELAGRLNSSYHQVPTIESFQMWERNGR